MKIELSTPSQVKQGEPVPVTLRLTNASDTTVTVYLQGRPTAFDIEVADESGRLIWQRLEGQVVAAILAVRSLAPGESLVFEDSWPQRDQAGRQVPSGAYAVTGALLTDAEPIRSRPAEVRILSRS